MRRRECARKRDRSPREEDWWAEVEGMVELAGCSKTAETRAEEVGTFFFALKKSIANRVRNLKNLL